LIERHRRKSKSKDEQAIPMRPGRLGRTVRWFIPNGGTLLIVAMLLMTQTLWAKPFAAPNAPGPSATTVNYQGRLADDAGAPLDGTYGMSFALYDAATGGDLIWGPEAHTAVPVSDGLFSVGLGSNTTGGIPTTTWNGDRYLEITVGGETLAPRELIRSVPIAGMALTVPDGAIESRQVHLTNGRVKPSVDRMSLTDSYEVIPGMSVEVSPATNQTYLFSLVAEFDDRSESASGLGAAKLFVDGEAQEGSAIMHWDANLASVSQIYLIDLEPGPHTIEVRALSKNGGGELLKWHTSLTWLAISQ
jgi:hypothetical protein